MRPAAFHVIDKPFEEDSWLRLKLKMLLTYGSLHTICMISSSISRTIDSGTLPVDDIVVEWRTLEDIYVPRDEQFRLAKLQQIIGLATVMLDKSLLMSCFDGNVKELRVVGLHRFLIGLLYGSLVRPPEQFRLLPYCIMLLKKFFVEILQRQRGDCFLLHCSCKLVLHLFHSLSKHFSVQSSSFYVEEAKLFKFWKCSLCGLQETSITHTTPS